MKELSKSDSICQKNYVQKGPVFFTHIVYELIHVLQYTCCECTNVYIFVAETVRSCPSHTAVTPAAHLCASISVVEHWHFKPTTSISAVQ